MAVSGVSFGDRCLARLTVAQMHAMLKAGILVEGAPVELIDGVLTCKDRSALGADPVTIGPKHNLALKLLGRLDPELALRRCHMQTQGPLSLPPHDEPEPDGVVLRGDVRDYADRLPSAGDAAAGIEVADASLGYDRTTKLSTPTPPARRRGPPARRRQVDRESAGRARARPPPRAAPAVLRRIATSQRARQLPRSGFVRCS